MGRIVIAASLLLVLAFAAPNASAADCPGGPSPCPYTAVSNLSEPAPASPIGPTDVAIAANGDFLVADRSDYKIRRYDDDGTQLSAFGERGPSLGQLDLPNSVTIDGDGNLWVAELNNNRLSKFIPAGDVLAVYGGSQGSGDTQTKLAEAMDVGPDGHIWIADSGNHRVVELAADGTFIRKFGSTMTNQFGPLPGTGPGEFNRPGGIVVTPAGDVWVADTFNNRLQRLPAGSSTWEIVGTSGSGPGEFFSPNDVEFEGGVLYVTQSNRTQRLSSGVWTDFGTGGGDGLGIGGGRLAIANALKRTVDVFDTAGGAAITLANPIRPPSSELQSPQAVAHDGAGSVYVADTDTDRVVRLDASTGALQNVIGTPGSGAGQLNDPWGVDFAGGRVFVADSSNDRIQEFQPDGTHVATYGGQGTMPGQFESPFGVAVAADGSLIVADTGNDRVQRSNPARDSWTVIGTPGTGVGQFDSPGDVAAAPNGDVWVADTSRDRIQRLSGGTWSAFGGTGSADGQFFTPRGIALTSDGASVLVTDTNRPRVQRFSASTGAFETKWGASRFDNQCPGEFADAWGITADPGGNVYVTDSLTGRLKKFRFSGQPALVDCDHTSPLVSAQTPAAGATVSATPTFTVTGGQLPGDSSTVTVRILRVNGTVTTVLRTLSSTTQSGGTFTINCCGAAGALPDGTYQWEATQGDGNGNRAVTSRRTFTVLGAPPAASELAITELNPGVAVSGPPPGANPLIDDDTPTFSGTAENLTGDSTDVTVRLERFNGTTFQPYRDVTVQRNGAGAWSATFDAPVPPDTYQVRASQVTDTGQKVTGNFFLQVTALTVSELNTGVPVVGLSPGANPVLDDNTPTFAGVALVRSGDANEVTVHLDRFNGSTFVADVHTFTTGRNGNGLWSATAPQLIDETWRVRVTQVTPTGTRESRPWFFQVITRPASPPLAITHLDENVTVSGTPPGANPLFTKSDPLIKGTASTADASAASVQVHYDRNSASGFVPDVHVVTAPRDATTGAWQARQILIDETWRVRVTQGTESSPGWFFQVKVPSAAPPPTASFALPVQSATDTTRRTTVPSVVGKSVFAARAALVAAIPNSDVNTLFSRQCTSRQTLEVLNQVPPAGATLTTSETATQPIALEVCDGGKKFLSDCSRDAIAEDLKELPRRGETGLSTELVLRLADCKVNVDVKTTTSTRPSTTSFEARKAKGGKAAIESTLRCSRTENDFAVALGEGQQIGSGSDTQFGLAEKAGMWKLPSHPGGAKSVVEIQVQNPGSELPPAEVYVDADAVQPKGAYLQPGQVFLTDGGGHARLQFVATKPGRVRLCVVQRVGESGVATWAGEIQVVPAGTGSIWETVMGRRIKVTEQGGGRLENRSSALAQPAVLDKLIEILVGLFGGRSRAVEEQATAQGTVSQKARKVFQTGGVGVMQVTLDGRLVAGALPPVPSSGPCLTGIGGILLRTTCPILTAAGGHAIVGGSTNGTPLAAEGRAAGVITKSGKLIGNDGSTLIGNDGSTLIGNDGSTLIGNDGSTLIGNDGSTLIGNDGSTRSGRRSTRIGNEGSLAIPVTSGSFTVPLGAQAFATARAAMVAGGAGNLLGNDGSTLVGPGGIK